MNLTSQTALPRAAFKDSDHTLSKRILTSCMIGNALEWYDFVIYGYFTVILGSLFFPKADPLTQVLASWGIFWTGFLARPLGSIVFGHIGDKISRKFALTLSIYMMAIPTALMGFMPTYAQVGILAPCLLVVLRAMQGFAIGGEFTGTMVFLVEHAPTHKRGFWGSWASFSAVIGVIIGSLCVCLLNHWISTENMYSFGWRIPFIISICGSLVGGYIRRSLSDPKVYMKAKAKRKKHSVPLKELFIHHKSKLGIVILLDFLTAVGFFVIVIFLATYFRTYLMVSEKNSLTINTISMVIFAISILIGGHLSDKFGRKPTLKFPCIGFILFAYPLFLLMQSGQLSLILLAQSALAIMMGIFFGTIPTALVEIIPTSVRFSGLSIGHNISMAIFGGGAPFVATHLISTTNNLASPAYLLTFAALASLSALWFLNEKNSSNN